jgi:hypothetical protein
MLIIPATSYPNFTEEIVLGEQLLRVSFSWNSRGSFWTVSFRDRDETVLLAGVKLVMGQELVGRYPGIALPSGRWFCVRGDGSLDRITQEEMGTDVNLIYTTEEELASL